MEKRYPAAIMATAVIPWDENNEFISNLFVRQVEHLIDNGIRHIYLFGTAGEGYAVNNRQFETIVKLFTKTMAGEGLHPMVGLIDLSLARMTEKLEIAYSQGIREFQFSLPSWGALNTEEVFNFFKLLLPQYGDCMFLNYNLTKTKRFLEPAELFRLAELHPNFSAVKYTRGSEKDFKDITESGTPLQFFLTEQNFMELSRTSDCGLLMSIGNVDLVRTTEFFNQCHSHDYENAEKYLATLLSLRDEMKNVMDFQAIDGAYDKLYTKYNLNEFPLRMLPPYQCASDEIYLKFSEAAKKLLKI